MSHRTVPLKLAPARGIRTTSATAYHLAGLRPLDRSRRLAADRSSQADRRSKFKPRLDGAVWTGSSSAPSCGPR